MKRSLVPRAGARCIPRTLRNRGARASRSGQEARSGRWCAAEDRDAGLGVEEERRVALGLVRLPIGLGNRRATDCFALGEDCSKSSSIF
jgi:hypothetical protein